MCDRSTKRLPPCCAQKEGSLCAGPTPRATNSYYSRNHKGGHFDSSECKGSCYCPDSCCCPHKGLKGRFAPKGICDPNNPATMERCCPRPGSPSCCCSNNCNNNNNNNACCNGDSCCQRGTGAGKPCPKSDCYCCPPLCKPYCPPCRKPVCYPPVKCCDPNDCGAKPKERICYYPCPTPPHPKYCTCGSPNPCECDLNQKRRQAIAEMAPCCRRCGRKVYAAEKIMASGGAFHTACFSCYCCHKPLEVTNVYDNQGEIYCKHCYARYFGVTGYGYGATLQSSI